MADHPMLFVTFTSPSFGAVHAHRSKGGLLHPCRPRRSGRCRHGIPRACWQRHAQDDPKVGHALCSRCFDYDGQVLWNALAPELWRRTTIYIRRAMATAVGATSRELEQMVRLSFVKVAEYQARGALHFHVVLRLDGVCSESDHLPAPPPTFTTEVLEQAVCKAASKVYAPLASSVESDRPLVARWGSRLDVQAVRCSPSALTPDAVAAYVAKYATKSSDDLGLGDLSNLGARAETDHHLVMLVRASERLGERLEFRKMRLSDCAYALGFKGHWSTKSRRYSTTFGALRRARREYVRRLCRKNHEPLDAWGRQEDEELIQVRGHWRFAGCGYRNTGEAWLAQCAATRARQHRRLARDELSMGSKKRGQP